MGIGAAVALAAGLQAGTTAFVVVSTVVNLAVSFAVSAITSSFAPKAKAPAGAPPVTLSRTINTRQPVTPWDWVVGEVRKGGPITYEELTDNNKFYHRIVTLAAHPCEAALAYYLDDAVIYPEQLDSSGVVQVGPYRNYVRIQIDLGTTGAQPFPDLVTDSDGKWTDAHRQEGHTKVYVRYAFNSHSADRFGGGPPEITVRLRGKRYTDTRTAAETFGTNASQIINDYLTTAKTAGGNGVASANVDSTILNASANVDDEAVAVASGQTHDVTSVDTSADTLDLDGDLAKFVSGDIVEATTTGTLPAGLATSTEYYVDVIRERSSDSASIRVGLATSLANVWAGTYVSITDAGSGTHTLEKTKEPRYTANGVIATDREPHDIIDDLKSAFGGRVFPIGDKWFIRSGSYATPDYTFDEDDLVDSIKWQSKVTGRERFNTVRGLYVSPLLFDQPDEYPTVADATAVAADGEDKVLDRNLPFTNRHSTAQRLVTIELQRASRELTLELPLNLRGALVQCGDTIGVTNTRLGLSADTFEVLEWNFRTEEGEDGAPTDKVNLSVRQIDSSVFSYSTSGEITQAPRSVTSLPDPFAIASVTGLMLTSGTDALFTKADGTVVSRLQIDWTESVDGTLNGTRIEVKKSSDSDYMSLGVFPPGQTRAYAWEVEDGIAYDVRATALGFFGGEDDNPPEATNHVIVGKTEAPSTPASFTITVDADGTRVFAWDPVADADVRAGGGYVIRYYSGTTSDWSAMTALHDGILVATPHESNRLSAGTYTFAIKAVDSSGNESTTAAFISAVAIADPRIGNVLLQRDERTLGWPGSLTDGFIDGSVLRATGSDTWADLPTTWTGLASSWAEIATPNSPMVYETPEIDVTGSGFDVTFRPLVSVTAIGTATITMQTGTDADGGVTGSFVSLDSVTARYVKIRVSVAGSTPGLDEMVTLIDSPAKTEDFNDVDTSAASSGLFETVATGHFKIGTKGGIGVITQAQITAIQNVGAGYTWELISKSTTLTGGELAAEFKIYDSSGTLADATVDVLLRGVKAT